MNMEYLGGFQDWDQRAIEQKAVNTIAPDSSRRMYYMNIMYRLYT